MTPDHNCADQSVQISRGQTECLICRERELAAAADAAQALQGVTKLAADCELAAKVMAETGTFETGQAILKEAAAALTALAAQVATLPWELRAGSSGPYYQAYDPVYETIRLADDEAGCDEIDKHRAAKIRAALEPQPTSLQKVQTALEAAPAQEGARKEAAQLLHDMLHMKNGAHEGLNREDVHKLWDATKEEQGFAAVVAFLTAVIGEPRT